MRLLYYYYYEIVEESSTVLIPCVLYAILRSMALRKFLGEIAGVSVHVDDILLVFHENNLDTPYKLAKFMREGGGELTADQLSAKDIGIMGRALRAAALVYPPNLKRGIKRQQEVVVVPDEESDRRSAGKTVKKECVTAGESEEVGSDVPID